MSDFWLNVVGVYVAAALFFGLLRSESPAAAVAVLLLVCVTIWLTMEAHVWLVCREPVNTEGEAP